MNKESLIQDLKNLGVKPGDLLYIKASMRSIGKVESGVRAFIEAVLDVIGKEGTLVVSSFVKIHPLSYLKNHPEVCNDLSTHSYAGAVANEIMKVPEVVLSRHPVQKFAAIGKQAEKLMLFHTEHSYAYDPLRVMSEIGGKGLILGKNVVGVGTTHVAVGLLGYKQKRPKVGVRFKNDDGDIKLFALDWAGLCSRAIYNLLPEYDKIPQAVISRAKVGEADTILTDMKKTLEIELDLLGKDTKHLDCGDKNCYQCQLSWRFSKGSTLGYLLRNLVRFNKKNLKQFYTAYVRGRWQPMEAREDLLFMGKSYILKK